MSDLSFDVVIIGSGIAGSALGAILARQGLRVALFEAKSHPRFAIGESLILETSELMRAMADLFDVPELAYFSSENFFPFAGTSHGVKRHFGFLHHTAGQPHDPRRTLQAVIPKEPHGHELHLYRQDTDYFLLSTAVAYGATVYQNTAVQDIHLQPDHVTIIPAKGEPVTARYVVDAGGYRSILADKFQARHTDLQTHSRGLFTHMVGVPGFEATAVSPRDYGLPYAMAEGTLHHVFDGGWLWVIPFNNHPEATNPLCSVGLMLDPRQFPPRDDLTPEEEFFEFIARYPAIQAQLGRGRAVRDWVRAGRIQYSSRQVVGDRWALLGHAVGFIDPLYSKGLYTSLTAVFITAHLLLQAQITGDYSAQAFAPLERVTQEFVCTADRLVANSYKSFKNYRLWQVYAVQWLLGAYTELVRLDMMRARCGGDRAAYFQHLISLKLAGGGFAEFAAIADRVDGLIEAVDPADETAVTQTVAAINDLYAQVPWIASPFRDVLKGKTYLPKNKIRLELLRPGRGFMGQGAYRQHFFGEMSLIDVLAYGLREKIRFARPLIARRHRRLHRPTG